MTKPVTPLLTVDVIVELDNESTNEVSIVLIKRKNPPYGWALPGGFVDVGETLAQAAIREAREEISLDVELIELLGCYSDPGRDERGHTVSAVYIARSSGQPRAADDAAEVLLVKRNQLPENMAFDHGVILADYLHYCESGQSAPLTR
ncbi:MAG: NUDIX hydrolase [Thioalkalispiraceae bacterium]|jgi:8-oxo-dGTP diphosphatase